jgi:two-component system, OmpR family, sensor histidine kinase KdpD
MLFVAFVVSHLARRVRDHADAASARERRTASLYAASREIGAAHSRQELLDAAARHVREVFGADVALLVPGPDGHLEPMAADAETLDVCARDRSVAEWVWTAELEAGPGTDNHPDAIARYVPLKAAPKCAGVLALWPIRPLLLGDPDEHELLVAFAGLVGSALERTRLADEARLARLRVETEQLRNALLSSISHDLRTPLAVITGATSTLLEAEGPRDERSRRRLIETAHEEALRLARLVGNLLNMTRLEAGALHVQAEPQPLEEVVGAALTRLEDRLQNREVITNLPDELPLVPFDSVLIEQVFINLIDNAVKYSPPGAPLEVAVRVRDAFAEIEVADRGPGVPPVDAERIFEKFYRADEREGGGVGLGLAICRGIIAAHAGRIWVESREGAGASFRFTLPLQPVSPVAPALPTSHPVEAR